MTRLYKRLGVGLAAAALLLGLAGLQGAGEARAQTDPPAVYAGTVTIDGEAAADGTAIIAMEGETTCATGQVGRGLNNARVEMPGGYALQVLKSDCDGALTFMVGDAMAAETAEFDNSGGLNRLNLTVTSAMATEEPAPPDDETTETETPEPPEETATPSEPGDGGSMAPPDTGSGLASGSSATTTLAAALGALALATMLGGYALARRRG